MAIWQIGDEKAAKKERRRNEEAASSSKNIKRISVAIGSSRNVWPYRGETSASAKYQ